MDKEKTLNVTDQTLPLRIGVDACRHWYATPAGESVLARVQGIVGRMSADIFGYYALEMGVLSGHHAFLQDSRISSRFSLGMTPDDSVSLLGSPEHLPLTFHNLDLIVGSHVLDCTPHPHQVLREMERVLVPEGHCILVGFNPFSFKGMGQLRYLYRRHRAPCHYYSTFRIREWLSVLGFDVLEVVSAGFCPTVGEHYLFERTRWMDQLGERLRLVTGNVHIIHAQKKVSKLTPILPKARVRKPVLKPGMVVNSGAGVSSRENNNEKQ